MLAKTLQTCAFVMYGVLVHVMYTRVHIDWCSIDREAYQTMRQNIVEMVLATDMSKHFEHLSKFTTGVTSQVSG